MAPGLDQGMDCRQGLPVEWNRDTVNHNGDIHRVVIHLKCRTTNTLFLHLQRPVYFILDVVNEESQDSSMVHGMEKTPKR